MADPFKTSGTAGAATVDDAAVEVIDAIPGRIFKHLMIINEGANPGFFKIGAGGEPVRAAKALEAFDDVSIDEEKIFIQRPAGGPNMDTVFVVIW